MRDLPATIIDVAGQASGRRFPAIHWQVSGTKRHHRASVHREKLRWLKWYRIRAPGNRDSSGLPKPTWPLGAPEDAEWSYIRREGDIHEELFHLRDDVDEKRDLASDPSARSTLQQMRAVLDRLTAGPLSPHRFSR